MLQKRLVGLDSLYLQPVFIVSGFFESGDLKFNQWGFAYNCFPHLDQIVMSNLFSIVLNLVW